MHQDYKKYDTKVITRKLVSLPQNITDSQNIPFSKKIHRIRIDENSSDDSAEGRYLVFSFFFFLSFWAIQPLHSVSADAEAELQNLTTRSREYLVFGDLTSAYITLLPR